MVVFLLLLTIFTLGQVFPSHVADSSKVKNIWDKYDLSEILERGNYYVVLPHEDSKHYSREDIDN